MSAADLIAYFDGDAPSGDPTTINDLLNNKWLLIHELIEINELKKLGFRISSELLVTNPKEVDECHITATEFELLIAWENADLEWISSRIKDIMAWIKDPAMPTHLKSRCQNMLETYAK